jgi:hypothetical protein
MNWVVYFIWCSSFKIFLCVWAFCELQCDIAAMQMHRSQDSVVCCLGPAVLRHANSCKPNRQRYYYGLHIRKYTCGDAHYAHVLLNIIQSNRK